MVTHYFLNIKFPLPKNGRGKNDLSVNTITNHNLLSVPTADLCLSYR